MDFCEPRVTRIHGTQPKRITAQGDLSRGRFRRQLVSAHDHERREIVTPVETQPAHEIPLVSAARREARIDVGPRDEKGAALGSQTLDRAAGKVL
jgi:hypothetical protein